MGEIRVKVLLTNPFDEIPGVSSKRRRKPRQMEVDAIVDTGAVMSVLPLHVINKLGVALRTQRLAPHPDRPDQPVLNVR